MLLLWSNPFVSIAGVPAGYYYATQAEQPRKISDDDDLFFLAWLMFMRGAK